MGDIKLNDVPPNSEPATYKAIPETDVEEEAVNERPKNIIKAVSPEVDGADEKMLPKEEVVVPLKGALIIEKQNGDAKLDIGDLKTAFVGLTKEELLKYANDPFWVRLRWFLFISFWLLWLLMLIGAILIIIAAPKCDPPPPRTWWETGPLAELPALQEPSFDKLKDLGVSGVIIAWPEDAYFTNDSLFTLLKPYHENNINVIVDLSPHTSIWFNQSEQKQADFGDFYIWQGGKIGSSGEKEEPNNWLSPQNKSSWKYSPVRNEYYYAPTGLPHLNFRNANVTRRFAGVIRRFLANGAAGIRIREAPSLLVDAKFADYSGVQNPGGCVLTDYCFYTHAQTENLDDLGPLLKQWRDVVKNATDNGPFMIREELGGNIEAYKVNSSYVVDLPLQKHLFAKTDGASVVRTIETAFKANNLSWPLWQVDSGNDEKNMVAYLLPGTPLIALDSEGINKELLKVRKLKSIMRGSLEVYRHLNDSVLSFTRVAAGKPGVLVAYNPTSYRQVVNFAADIPSISEDVTVLLFSRNYNETGVEVNKKREAAAVPISANSTIVLQYVPKHD